jgi:hypothetical protein
MDGETPLVQYGSACFERVCPVCRRFVKADDTAMICEGYGGLTDDKRPANATCSKCGRVTMGFVGWFEL